MNVRVRIGDLLRTQRAGGNRRLNARLDGVKQDGRPD
jgi:hypothetical protein